MKKKKIESWKKKKKHFFKMIYYQVKMRQTMDNCLLGEAFWTSSVVQTLQPPSKLARTWAMPRRLAAANPITYASWLGSLHSNIHSFKCFSCSDHQIQHLVFQVWILCLCFWLSKRKYENNLPDFELLLLWCQESQLQHPKPLSRNKQKSQKV